MYPFVEFDLLRIGTCAMCLVTAVFVAYAVFLVELKLRGLEQLNVAEAFCALAVGAAAGARLHWTLDNIGRAPFTSLVLHGGFSYHGALIVDCVITLLLARHCRVPMLALSDALVIPCTLAYAIACVACFLAGDGGSGFECLTAVAIAVALWRYSSPTRRPSASTGEGSALFLILTGIARLALDFGRRNDAQVIALIFITAGLALLVRQTRRTRSGTAAARASRS